ncbi:sigma-70 family RNA polymerase sigma factor [Stieleria varia]|uniref:ECF RNA polymerase sigma factor SigG n=1 Tax=Stieleria varia TaxID=2528005 RepID=A0A5C6ALR3_9BACT|nr:sigma-70 family RNA polymerase sigma factor [Stieleria varia]TWU00973.1 ECF RNA polymerase sigma factor SigG [Stieleria varia]
MNSSEDSYIAESSLRQTWSIGPLRPWLLLLAERHMPADLRGKVDPSDLVQQALLDAWRGQTGFRGSTHAERLAWLRVILTRTMMRQRRDCLATEKRGMGREKTLQAAVDRDSIQLEQLAVGKEPDPQSVADRAEQTLRLAATLEKLSPEHRTVLTLRHIDGLSHDEIAERMGKTSAAVRMLWIRALEKLKQLHGS